MDADAKETGVDGASADLPPVGQAPERVFVGGREARAASTGSPRLPGSKYYTLRYLLNALLADGESVVRAPALSDDTAVLVRALRALGAEARWEPGAGGAWDLRVRGHGAALRQPPGGVIHAGNAGAALRLLLGIGALLPEIRFKTDHPESLGRRPNADLLDALRALGLQAEARELGGLLPITLRGGPPSGGAVSVSGRNSSQYLSALLYLAPSLTRGLDVSVTDGLRSAALVRVTLRALAEAGVRVDASPDLLRFHVPGGQRFAPREYATPGDMPSTAALVAATCALGAPLRLAGLPWEDEDARALVTALDTLGLPLSELPESANGGTLALAGSPTMIQRPGWHSSTRRIDGDAIIDSVPALVALACVIHGETHFENVATLRLKESDRIGDLCAELAQAGADVTPLPDAIIVRGRPEGVEGGVTVYAHDDHRVAQALAIVATRSQRGLTIEGAGAVAKSYPWFFEDLARLGAVIEAR